MDLLELTLAAIAWEPHIRGATAVAIGFVVLCGSVYLLLATNSGARTGLLLAIAGLAGWCAVMGVIWWVYGIGWIGQDPSWRAVEINYGDRSAAVTEVVASDPDLLTWDPVDQADSSFGELQATADEVLVNELGIFEPGGFVVLDVFKTGGKPERASDAVVDRVANRITNTLRITHPHRYAVVEVQPTIDPGPPVPGEAPPVPEADPAAPVVSLVVERDLGNRRFTPAAFTFFSAVVFGITANALHRRDKMEAENRARTEPVPA